MVEYNKTLDQEVARDGRTSILDGITINEIIRVGDMGESGYNVYGEDLPACKNQNKRDWWYRATRGAGCKVSQAMPNICYITESVYNFLTPEEREDARRHIRGIVADSYWKNGTCPYYPHTTVVYSVSTARQMPLPNQCKGVVREDVCGGTDPCESVCEDSACVSGGLTEASSLGCGADIDQDDTESGMGTDWIPYVFVGLGVASLYYILRGA